MGVESAESVWCVIEKEKIDGYNGGEWRER